MKFKSLDDLYLHELQDLYSAESQLIEAMPEMASKASSPQLKRALEMHLKQTKRQCEQVGKLLKDLGEEPGEMTCKGMQGLIKEGQEILKASGDEMTIDAALLGASNRVEHYEIAGYGTARAHAHMLGHDKHVRILQQILDEEGEADKKMTAIAEEMVNPQAVAH